MLSERQQRSRIYSIFTTADPNPRAHNLLDYDETWRPVLIRFRELFDLYDPEEIADTNWRFEHHEEFLECLQPVARAARCPVHDIVRSLAAAQNERRSFESMASLSPKLPEVTWLWENWIPRGLLTLLGATPGTGKSWLALALSKIVIEGGTWPDGALHSGGGNVVWVEAEAVPQITRDRCQSMGIDMRHLWPIVPPTGDILDFSRPEYRDTLIELVQHVKPQLIVIDSLSGISSKGENNIEDIRRILAFLVGLAAEYDAGLVLVHHLKKLDRSQLALPGLYLHDFRGSGHITAVARSIIGLSIQSPAGGAVKRTGPRLMEIVKATLVEEPEKLGMSIESQPDNRVSITFGEPPSAAGATTGDECANWLLDTLEANGPMKPRDVIELAETEDYSRPMVYRARKKLEGIIIDTEGRKNPANCWKIVDEADEPE